MSYTKTCDICDQIIYSNAPRYLLSRYNQQGHFDDIDLCSAECVAVAAVGEGHLRGNNEMADQWLKSMQDAELLKGRRHWWSK